MYASTNNLPAHWLVCQKLNIVGSVQLRRFVCTLINFSVVANVNLKLFFCVSQLLSS